MSLVTQGDFAVRRISVPAEELVMVRHVLEASEGVGFLVAESGGDAYVMSPIDLEEALDELLSDLANELPLQVSSEICWSELSGVAR